MSTVKRFPPHAILDELAIHPLKFEDIQTGVKTSFPSLELGDGAVRQSYDLGSEEWRQLRVSFEVSETGGRLSSVLQPGETVDGTIRAILSVRCPATMARFVVPLSRINGGWSGSVLLDRNSLRRVVVVRPLLYRASPPHPKPRQGRANAIGDLIGEGPAVDLRIDPLGNPFEGALNVKWEDFRASQDPWRRSHDGDLYALTFDPEPTVWLNSRHEAIQSLLHDPAATGIATIIRASLFSVIKDGVWSSLLRAASLSIERDPETDELIVPDGWQSTVLKAVLPHMYPEVGSFESQVDQLYDSMASSSSAAEVEVRLRTAVQALSSSAESFTRLVSTAEVSP